MYNTYANYTNIMIFKYEYHRSIYYLENRNYLFYIINNTLTLFNYVAIKKVLYYIN